jgi:adenylosuccinate synthase
MPIPEKIVLLSGAVSSGKSVLAGMLVQRFGFQRLKTKEVIKKKFPKAGNNRRSLQECGERLDRKTGGSWVRDEIQLLIDEKEPERLLVDAVRIKKQVDAIRKAYGPHVQHIHLEASPDLLRERYKLKRMEGFEELPSYDDVAHDPVEKQVNQLKKIADVVIQILHSNEEDVLVRAASHLGLYGAEHERLVDVLVGGQYGSEGKGHVASYLAREYDILVRVGGPNAGHTVFHDPEPYTHHHLPSGTRFSRARLLIAPGAVLSVPSLLQEIADCDVSTERLSIDPQAMVIDKEDIAREKKLVESIGSTGQGVGAATARRILGRSETPRLARDIPELKPYTTKPVREVLEQAYLERRRILLEGTQGVGLSLYHGSYPYVTSRDTTVAGCLAEAGIAPTRVRKVLMVCRTYPIRVQDPQDGSSGPMSEEISWKVIADRSGIPLEELEHLELTSTTRRKRRVGEFDWALLRKAASLNGPTDIALTFADYISAKNTRARRFEQLTQETIRFAEEIEKVSGAPVSLISTRFHWRSIIDRRSW